jgi:hypothetical protein
MSLNNKRILAALSEKDNMIEREKKLVCDIRKERERHS